MAKENGGFLNIKDLSKEKKKANADLPEEEKGVSEEQSKKETMLVDALKDIDKELGALRIQKEKIEGKLNGVSEDITGTQVEESKLREEISTLVGKEGMLEKKRIKLVRT